MEFDKEGAESQVARFEEMLRNSDEYYFDAEEFDRIAEHYLGSGDHGKALRCVRIGSSQHPYNPQLQFRKAQILASAGKLNKSLDILLELEASEPFNAEVLLMIAGIYGQFQDHGAAIQYYQKAKDHSDEYIDDILTDIAFEYESAERYDDAIRALQEALERNPANETAISELAHVYELAGKVEESIHIYQQLIDEDPYSHTAWYNLGNAYVKLGLTEKALEAYEYCTLIKDDFSSAHFNKGNAHVQVDQYHEAIQAYNKCLRLEPPLPVTHCYIGECYEKLDRLDLAVRHYQKALELDPEWVDAWVGIGVVKDLEGHTVESLNYLKKAVTLSEEEPDTWLILAKALHKAEFYLEARQAYEEVAHLAPDTVELWMEYSRMEADFVSITAGLDVIERGLEIYSDQPELIYRMVAYLLRLGRRQEGLEHLEEALVLDHESHTGLLDYYPDAQHIPEVLELIQLYKNTP